MGALGDFRVATPLLVMATDMAMPPCVSVSSARPMTDGVTTRIAVVTTTVRLVSTTTMDLGLTIGQLLAATLHLVTQAVTVRGLEFLAQATFQGHPLVVIFPRATQQADTRPFFTDRAGRMTVHGTATKVHNTKLVGVHKVVRLSQRRSFAESRLLNRVVGFKASVRRLVLLGLRRSELALLTTRRSGALRHLQFVSQARLRRVLLRPFASRARLARFRLSDSRSPHAR